MELRTPTALLVVQKCLRHEYLLAHPCGAHHCPSGLSPPPPHGPSANHLALPLSRATSSIAAAAAAAADAEALPGGVAAAAQAAAAEAVEAQAAPAEAASAVPPPTAAAAAADGSCSRAIGVVVGSRPIAVAISRVVVLHGTFGQINTSMSDFEVIQHRLHIHGYIDTFIQKRAGLFIIA